ncbi:MAG: ATP-binding protein [Byssovorax sp.]
MVSPGAPENPFATHRHRAGALAYRFAEGISIAARFEALLAGAGQAQIVGAEGTGKSTLLAALAREAERREKKPLFWLVPHDGMVPGLHPAQAPGRAILFLDEADRLSWLRLQWLRYTCRRAEIALVAATHRPLGMPTLFETRVDEALACAIAAEVLDRSPEAPRLVHAEEAGPLLGSLGGNMRAVLLALYDRYEERYALAHGRASEPPAA